MVIAWFDMACIITKLFPARSHIFATQGCVQSKTLSYFLKMGGGKTRRNATDRHKEQKVWSSVWRPVSTTSSSSQADPRIMADGPVTGLTVSSTITTSEVDLCTKSEMIEEGSVSFASEVENLPEDHDCENGVGLAQGLNEAILVETSHELVASRDADLTKSSLSIQVDASLIRFVKGKRESTQKQIEEETGVKLIFPSSKEDNCIVIEGNCIDHVHKAATKIRSVIEEAIKSPSLDYSHFISLPLAIHPELVDRLHGFQKSILGDAFSIQGNSDSDSDEGSADEKDDNDQLTSPNVAVKLEVQDKNEHVKVQMDTQSTRCVVSEQSRHSSVLSGLGIDSSIFIKPKTFHLTVLMLKLWNKDRVSAAAEVLQRISSEVRYALENRPVSVRLKGLERMRGSPAKARVVYAPVEEIGGEGRLLRACRIITEAYVGAGLVLEKDARQSLKLHATLMNARHRKRRKDVRRQDSFDARGIFLRYGSENWGDYLIREAHLSQRFVFDQSGYYHCCASIPFPENMLAE